MVSQHWIETRNVTKRFGTHAAVDNVSLQVTKGDVLGFLGPNGAGKTTTMRMITGFLEPTEGQVFIHGMDMLQHRLELQKHIGYLPEGAPLYPEMTPKQFLTFVGSVRGMSPSLYRQRCEEVVALLGLEPVLHQAIDTLSKGFKRRVGLAQAILHDPDILILDEPTDGLDPLQKQEVRRLIRHMASHKAIIISTHILEEVETVCTRAAIIAHGKLRADSTPQELLKQSRTHNRVLLTLASADCKKAKELLERLTTVKEVKILENDEEATQFVLVPKEESVNLRDIGQLAYEQKWEVDKLQVERGKLDEVFIELAGKRKRKGA
jgi:ABC-2 type transport system ATP-binding protein